MMKRSAEELVKGILNKLRRHATTNWGFIEKHMHVYTRSLKQFEQQRDTLSMTEGPTHAKPL